MYNLDFDTMRQVMREHQQTGKLYADVPSGVARIRGPCRVEITLQAGNIVTCSITNNAGERLINKDAVHHLSRLGRLRWTLAPIQSSIAQSEVVLAIVPQRAVLVEPLQMRSWPRLHRLVFALADGATSAGKIAERLTAPLELVDQTLRDLQRIGVITMERQSSNRRP